MMKKSTTLLMTMALILLLFLPSLSGNNYYFLHVSIMVGIFIILSQGLNILFGFAGQISIGHAAFYAIGAYASAITAHHFSFPFALALLAAVLFTSLIGFLLGITCLRLRGEYLAITTVAFGEIVQVILTQWDGVSGGPEGFLTIPKAHLGPLVFDTPGRYYYLTLVITVLIMILTRNLASSKLGRSFQSVKDDILAANIMGIDTTRVKIVAFVLSAAYSGLAGSLYAHYSRALLPDYFNLSLSVLIFMMVMLGGMGTLYGPIVGAILLTVSFELLRAFQVYQMVVYGIVVLLITLFAPDGLVGITKKMFRKKPVNAVQPYGRTIS